MEPRRHPVIVLICFALVTNSIFAACPTHTGAPPEEAPHFDLQHYATGDWFGLCNTLYDYGIEGITTTADFLTSPFYCQFVNNGICGQPPAPFFNMPNGITAYPAAYWGAVARVQTTKETYAKFGVYDGDPASGDDRHGANFGFGDNGTLIFTEVGYQTKEGLWGMPSRYSFGGYVHTA
jgi:hypothetical protein